MPPCQRTRASRPGGVDADISPGDATSRLIDFLCGMEWLRGAPRGAVGFTRGPRQERETVKRQLDFIVIGAQKSGTTALFEYLRRHPELALPEAKEVPYFSHDANYRRDFDEYLRKAFAFAGEGRM